RRPRDATVFAVGQGEGAARRRHHRPAPIHAHRAVAQAVPPRGRRLALRHPARRQLDPGGADPLFRPRPLVHAAARRAGRRLRPGQRQAGRPPRAARPLRGHDHVFRRTVRRHRPVPRRLGTPPDGETFRHRRRPVGVVVWRDGPHVRTDVFPQGPARRRGGNDSDPEGGGRGVRAGRPVRTVRAGGADRRRPGGDGRGRALVGADVLAGGGIGADGGAGAAYGLVRGQRRSSLIIKRTQSLDLDFHLIGGNISGPEPGRHLWQGAPLALVVDVHMVLSAGKALEVPELAG